MEEITKKAVIGLSSKNDQTRETLKKNLKLLKFRRFVECPSLEETYQVIHSGIPKLDALIIDFRFDDQLIHQVILDFQHAAGHGHIPLLLLTDQYKMQSDDITFLKIVNIRSVLALPFTEDALFLSLQKTWDTFHSNKGLTPFIKMLNAINAQVASKNLQAAMDLVLRLKKAPFCDKVAGQLFIEAHMRLGNKNIGVNAAKKLVVDYPNDEFNKLRMAFYLLTGKEYVAAYKMAKSIDRLKLNVTDIDLYMGTSLFHLKKRKEALNIFNKYIRHGEKTLSVLNMVAICYKEMGDFPQAVQFYQTCLQIDPDVIPIKYNLSLLYIQMNKRREAIQILNEVLQKDRGYTKAQLRLAELTTKIKA